MITGTQVKRLGRIIDFPLVLSSVLRIYKQVIKSPRPGQVVLPMHARVTKSNEWLAIPESKVTVTSELTYAEIEFLLSHLPVRSDLSVKLAITETAVFPKTRLIELWD